MPSHLLLPALRPLPLPAQLRRLRPPPRWPPPHAPQLFPHRRRLPSHPLPPPLHLRRLLSRPLWPPPHPLRLSPHLRRLPLHPLPPSRLSAHLLHVRGDRQQHLLQPPLNPL